MSANLAPRKGDIVRAEVFGRVEYVTVLGRKPGKIKVRRSAWQWPEITSIPTADVAEIVSPAPSLATAIA